MKFLSTEQIANLENDSVCPDCGTAHVYTTTTAPERFVCDECGWSEYVEAVNNM